MEYPAGPTGSRQVCWMVELALSVGYKRPVNGVLEKVPHKI